MQYIHCATENSMTVLLFVFRPRALSWFAVKMSAACLLCNNGAISILFSSINTPSFPTVMITYVNDKCTKTIHAKIGYQLDRTKDSIEDWAFTRGHFARYGS